jgi:RHS repeat-associated protein
LQPVSDEAETIVGFPDAVLAQFPELAGVQLVVPADALFRPDGERGGMIGIAPVPPDRLPAPLPAGLEFSIVITVQTDGAENFDRPVAACFPNLPDPRSGEPLAPGAEAALWSFNHDLGRFEVVGTMHVTADGRLVCTDPGVGIPAPGWHGVQQGTSGSGGDVTGSTAGPRTRARGGNQECSKDDCPCSGSCETENAVLLHSGEERFMRTDLEIPGRGDIHFAMRRTYRSQLDYDGPLGFGWDFTYNEGLYLEANGDLTRLNGGGHLDTWELNPDGTFNAPGGHFRTLAARDDGTFVLRSPDGFRRYYDAGGRLFADEDRWGNRMLFYYDARGTLDRVVDAYGREIDFEFQTFAGGVDRLVRIVDFIGREVVYRYDGNGDLVEVRSPRVTGTSTANDFPNGRAERYVYSAGFAQPELNHNLLRLVRPQEVAGNGPPALQWTYGTDPNDPATFDKVLTETKGGTNASGIAAGGTTGFAYQSLNDDEPLGQPDLPRGQATVTERNGNVWEHFVNERGHHILTRRRTRGLREGEPPFYETRSSYDADGLLVRQVDPEGNEMRYRYDSDAARGQQQNVIEARRIAGPRGGGEDLVTTYSYEPLYNQIASITDPRGNASGFTPPLGAASAARYTTRFFYDYQESNDPVEHAQAFGIDLSSVARGLGDLNDDDRTDQAFGNVVRTEEPSVLQQAASPAARGIGSSTQSIVQEIQWNDAGQIVGAIDPEGNVTARTYYPEDDPDGDGIRTLAVYRPLSAERIGYPERMTKDARTSPRRTASVDPVQLETVYRYDPVGNVVAVRNPRGVLTAVELNALNEPVVITRGAEVSEAVASGQLLTGETPLRYRARMFYDHNGRRVRSEIENRDSTTEGVGEFIERDTTYDILDNPLEQTVEVAAQELLQTRYRYDPNERLVRIIQPAGNQVAIEHDERDLPFRITRGSGSPEPSTIRIDYDRNGNQIRLSDAEDNDGDGAPESVTLVYDGFDRRIEGIDPLGNRFLTAYDVNSNVVARQVFGHPPGQPEAEPVRLYDASFHHDELNRLFEVEEALFVSAGFSPARAVDLRDQNGDALVTNRIEYDALSRQTGYVEDDGERTRVVFDGASRAIERTDALGNSVFTEYDRNSNPVEVTLVELSPDGLVPDEAFTTVYVYDQLDRLVRASDNAGQTARFAYDSRDNLVARSDPEGALVQDPLGLFPGAINDAGNTRAFIFDGFDRMIAELSDLRVGGTGAGPLDTSNPANPDGRISVAYEWDANSRLSAVVDDNGNRTMFEYDELDRRVRRVNADGEAYRYTYDRDDNLREVVDPNGSVVTRTYDALHRPVEIQVARAPGVVGTMRERIEYDGLSRHTRRSDDNGSPATEQVNDYVYDSLSRVLEDRQNGGVVSSIWSGDGKRLTTTYPGGRVITRTHDPVDRVRRIEDSGGLIADAAWMGPNYRALRRLHGNGTQLSFLDATGSEDVGYDPVQRIVRLRALLPNGVDAFVDREYAYNRADQRTLERRHDDFGLTDRYAYDSVYRIVRTELDTDGTPAAVPRDLMTLAYLLDGVGNRRGVDRMLSSSGTSSATWLVNEMNEYTAVDGIAQRHDDNGNLIDDGARLYAYDYKNRLVEVRDKSTGMPVASYLYLADGRRSRKRVLGGGGSDTAYFYEDWQICEERDGISGSTEATYVYGPVFPDDVIQLARTAAHPLGAGTFYLHQNARADVVAVTNASGVVLEKVLYDDFGNPDQTSAVGNPYLFQGRQYDAESGLYYFRNRYYDPRTGRFLQRDPMWDAANLGNPYTFAGNGPASNLDPLGTDAFHEASISRDARFWQQVMDQRLRELSDFGRRVPRWDAAKGRMLSAMENFLGHAEQIASKLNEARNALRQMIRSGACPRTTDALRRMIERYAASLERVGSDVLRQTAQYSAEHARAAREAARAARAALNAGRSAEEGLRDARAAQQARAAAQAAAVQAAEAEMAAAEAANAARAARAARALRIARGVAGAAGGFLVGEAVIRGSEAMLEAAKIELSVAEREEAQSVINQALADKVVQPFEIEQMNYAQALLYIAAVRQAEIDMEIQRRNACPQGGGR